MFCPFELRGVSGAGWSRLTSKIKKITILAISEINMELFTLYAVFTCNCLDGLNMPTTDELVSGCRQFMLQGVGVRNMQIESVHCMSVQKQGQLQTIPSGKRLHNYGTSPCVMGKSTISMAMFNSYVCLPEGISY